MIFAKDGNIQIDGTEESVMQDWCILTDALFKQMFKEYYAEKLSEVVEFILENSDEFDKMKEK